MKIHANIGSRHASHMPTRISLGTTFDGIGRLFHAINNYDLEGVSKIADHCNTEIQSTICLAQMVLVSTMHVLPEFGGNSACLRQKLVQRRFSC